MQILWPMCNGVFFDFSTQLYAVWIIVMNIFRRRMLFCPARRLPIECSIEEPSIIFVGLNLYCLSQVSICYLQIGFSSTSSPTKGIQMMFQIQRHVHKQCKKICTANRLETLSNIEHQRNNNQR